MFGRLLIALSVALFSAASALQVGVGIYDMTGPVTEINFMGYAMPGQRGQGIHTRLRARAFVFADEGKRNVYVSVDGGMGSDLVNMRVVDVLNERIGQGVYTVDNICISGTHTHSGPAGFLQYVLFQITSMGFVKETFDTWVSSISEAIIMAHNNLQDGKVLFAQGALYGANINRSPTSYQLNPADEIAAYPEGDTDKNMFLLKLVNKRDKPLGMAAWFSVHGTSMNNTNKLTSGDNKGYASYAVERAMNGKNAEVGKGPFVAAFGSTNLGDVSPNTNGPRCIDTGLPCDGTKSTCNGKCENCIASGPGTNGDMFESTKIIGTKQADFATQLMAGETEEITGPVDYRHSWVKLDDLNVTLADGSSVKLCTPSMGYSFAAGTTDGPGMFGFTQGTTSGNPFWDKVRDFLSVPTEEEIACQAPKPIFINTGDIDTPYPWDPHTVPIQILRVGNVFILAAPVEFTTMAGRRLRKAVSSILEGAMTDGKKPHVTIAGLANNYASYVVTFEEYQAQRYEAASTIFGPNSLNAYIQEFSRLAKDIVNGQPSATGPGPEDLTGVQIQLMAEPKFDRVASGFNFGDIVQGFDVLPSYTIGQLAEAQFHAANPRNNQRIQGSYVTIEKQNRLLHEVYETVAYDGDWSTKFRWVAGPEDPLDFGVSKKSVATITWDTTEAEEGTYRICYHGDHKIAKLAKIVPFTGCSSLFQVSA